MLIEQETPKTSRILEKRSGANVSSTVPRVSIVIPAYNSAEFVAETLDSAFSQTFKDYEIIFVNDGSPDTEILEKVLSAYFDRIVYIKQENCGAAAARNTAIENARGEFLAFLDSDDVWLPEYLATQIDAITARGCDMIYADAFLFGNLAPQDSTFMTECPSAGEVTTESLMNATCNVLNSGTVVRREKILSVGMLDETLPRNAAEDFDLWFRMARSGAKIEYQKKVLLKYRVHEKSLSGTTLQRSERAVLVFKLLEEKYELTPSEKETLKNQQKAAIAELQVEKGKYNLVRKDFALARENFRAANQYYKKFKYTALDLFLTISPKLTLKLFLKARPTEASLIIDGSSDLKSASAKSEFKGEQSQS